MYKIIDTHTHLNSEQLYLLREEIYKDCRNKGIEKVINNADSIDSFRVIDELAQEYPTFSYSAIGIFPCEGKVLEEDIASLKKALKEVHNVVAVGEIGLDYYYGKDDKEKQQALFKAQIEVAKEFDLPLIIHSRDADEDTFNILMNADFKNDITLHCYSGSYQLAERYIRNHPNTFFGIGGVLTFKNARRLVEVVEHIDLSHLLLETDAPYLAPVPYRGQMNKPQYTIEVLAKIAEIKKLNIDEVASSIYETSKRVYKL